MARLVRCLSSRRATSLHIANQCAFGWLSPSKHIGRYAGSNPAALTTPHGVLRTLERQPRAGPQLRRIGMAQLLECDRCAFRTPGHVTQGGHGREVSASGWLFVAYPQVPQTVTRTAKAVTVPAAPLLCPSCVAALRGFLAPILPSAV